jgi:tetratricopeptide (TPR) repeat protein
MTELAAILTERYLLDDEAKELLLDVIEIQARTLGEQNHRTLMSHHLLGKWYWKKGGLRAEAHSHFEKAATGLEQLFGKEHRDRLSVLHSMAQNLKHAEEDGYARAEALFDEVLEAQRRLLGDTHPDVLITLNDLGILYQQSDRLDEAERIHLDLAATTIALGHDRPGWSPQGSYYQAACVAAFRGDADQAFEYLERALASDEHGQFPYWVLTDKDLRPLRKDPRWPVILEQVGRHRLVKNGYDPAALRILRSAAYRYDTSLSRPQQGFALTLEVWKSHLEHQGEDHPRTVSARNDAAMLAWQAGYPARTEELVGPLGVLEPLTQEGQTGLTSTKGETLRSGIVFVNRTDRDLDFYWINWEGLPRHRGTVPARTSVARSSGPRQAWKFGETVFLATEHPSTATVSN